MSTSAATQPQTSSRIDCLCGCGQTTSPKANYRPGHDASHVSLLLATIIDHQDLSQGAVKEYLKALPTPALQAKLQKAVDNFAGRQAAKKAPRTPKAEAKTEWVDSDTDEFKAGRWTYPVQELIDPSKPEETLAYRRNTKRDGSGEWVDLEGGELIGR
ncbi:hypothetical protein SEA_SUCHA_62 [Microbacterium phage Sucha]|nr:hypothetical protein SEA_SUCHA_62 [Microbacterium phage Sucha]